LSGTISGRNCAMRQEKVMNSNPHTVWKLGAETRPVTVDSSMPARRWARSAAITVPWSNPLLGA
jgi:hypothetical protein